mmetsp:Transcript_76180/g.143574  ORF Transcript_76180/g.143574 Transcript_76180/m.143574 type:complete len:82 (-) Transcript_76180:381-626(-)
MLTKIHCQPMQIHCQTMLMHKTDLSTEEAVHASLPKKDLKAKAEVKLMKLQPQLPPIHQDQPSLLPDNVGKGCIVLSAGVI